MNKMTRERAVTYDYKTVKVKREAEAMYCDVYANFGWELTNSRMADASLTSVYLSFKRDRAIGKKPELIKISAAADASLNKISALQRKKRDAGTAWGVSVGTIGVLTFGGGMSMCLLLKGTGYLIGGIGLGLLGAALCAAGFFLYKRINGKAEAELAPKIETETDKVSCLCEEANKIIYGE
ncbi:MAG: hypothetical protein ACI4S9_07360 [Christensenellales bacterium]